MDLPQQRSARALREMRIAMGLSLAVAVLMLVGKSAAYLLTDSSAILSDAAESVVHVVAVGFAAFSLRLSLRPADARFRYGYERITYFSAGFEGAFIALAALYIIVTVAWKWMAGLETRHLGVGAIFIAAAAVANALLGWYLVRTGRRTRSMILEANGQHVLTDSWTSFGVVAGLCLVVWTGWKPFDPLCAFAVALNILWSGGRLVWRSVRGLMDFSDPAMGRALREQLDVLCSELDVRYHGLRFRSTGYRTLVELHLLFRYEVSVGKAHQIATSIEKQLPRTLSAPIEVVTHLEAMEDHDRIHGTTRHTTR